MGILYCVLFYFFLFEHGIELNSLIIKSLRARASGREARKYSSCSGVDVVGGADVGGVGGGVVGWSVESVVGGGGGVEEEEEVEKRREGEEYNLAV